MNMLSSPPGIDGQFCKLMINYLPWITYPQKELKYFSKKLAKEMPDGRPDESFFKKWAWEIFVQPYAQYQRKKNANKFLSSKKEVMVEFTRHLREYLLTEFGAVIFADLFKDLDELLAKAYPDQHRDHVLHQGNVLLLGLLCYYHSFFIRKKHEKMLNLQPESPGCIARDKTLSFQFFQQWFNVAAVHDVGYTFEILAERKEFDFIDEVVSYFNRWLQGIVPDTYGLPTPSQVSFDRGLKRLDIGDLYEVKYLWPAESHLTKRNLWRETLEKLKELESKVQKTPDHGICGAKLLLKSGNVVIKWEELNKEANPSARFSYRNYILPTLSIAKHNIQPKAVSAEKNVIFEHPKKAFETEFLACLTTLCDEASEFDRMVAGKLRLGIDLRTEIIDLERDSFILRLIQV